MDQQTSDIYVGQTVYGSDNEKVGKIQAIYDGYFVVEKGLFFPKDYAIPSNAVTSVDGDSLFLSVSKDEVLNQGWGDVPEGTMTDSTYVGAAENYGQGSIDQPMVTDTMGTDTGVTGTRTTGYADRQATGNAGATMEDRPFEHAATGPSEEHIDDEDRIRVPVHEEELVAASERELGQIRIEKDVVAEEQAMDVPVSEERVRVQRHVVDRDVAPGEAAFDEGTIDVPVRGEEVDVAKRARVTEEVDIDKDVVQRTERVGGTVRREEVRVDDATGGTIRETDRPGR